MKFSLLAAATLLCAVFGMGAAAPLDAGAEAAANTSVQCRMAVANAHDSAWFTYNIRAGQQLTIAFRGDGDTNMDLYVYDEFGRLIIRTNDPADQGAVLVRSAIDQTIRIEVRNHGRVWNRFAICVE